MIGTKMNAVAPTKSADAREPRYIRLHPEDNVAIVVNDFGLPAGTIFPGGLTLKDYVPQGHKVALVDIGEGEHIRRYNQIIGYAETPISAGSWVSEALMAMPTPPPLAELPLATAIPAKQPPLEGYT